MANQIFAELYVKSVKENIDFFCTALGFALIRDEGDFAELRHGTSIFLLNGGASDVPGHFFHGKINPSTNGIGVEIGIMVDDVKLIHKNVSNCPMVKQISDVKLQDWGMADFRIVTEDNYYLRITSKKNS